MIKGFFSLLKTQSNVQTPRIPRCGLCGLYKYCISPKMPPTGEGGKKILFVAEAPGENEDRENIQLIGKVGKYLRRKYLRPLGIDLDRDCWKTNALICRPKDNKKPEDYMIEACRPNLMKTIRKCKPNVIILMGEVACKSLLKEIWKDNLGKISRWGGFCIPCTEPNVWIIPTYHPSYVMRMDNEVLDRIFKKHLQLGISKAKNKPWVEIPNYEKEIEIIIRPAQVAKAIKEFIKKGGVSSVDFETNCLKPEGKGTDIVSCSICWRGRRTISYPWQGESIDATDDFLKSPLPKIASNLKFEDRWSRAKLGHPVKVWYWDTMIAAHVLDNRPDITGLKFQAFVLLGARPYDEHIKPYLQAKKGSRFNRINELDLMELLLYGGLDSYLEYWLAMKQIEQMENRK